MKHKNSQEPQEWLEKAHHDLVAAKNLFKQDGFPDTIAVHCHQTAEKALKGALLWLGIDYPFTHDLSLLIKLCCDKDNAFKNITDVAIKLSPLYEEERYPFAEEEPYTDEELEDFIALAENIYNFIKERIKFKKNLDKC